MASLKLISRNVCDLTTFPSMFVWHLNGGELSINKVKGGPPPFHSGALSSSPNNVSLISNEVDSEANILDARIETLPWKM